MIIIPARLKSTRFPNKVLASIRGIPMVVRTAQLAQKIDDVAVACDDSSILDICSHYNIPAILTSTTHESGTDRIAECARILGLPNSETIINLQADEPFLEPEVIQTLKALMESKRPFMGSCAKQITQDAAEDPNLVKVVLSQNDEAIYFSRAKIPYNMNNLDSICYYGHLGIYGFSMTSLQEFCMLKKAPLENIERLEQLRALENGKTIAMAKVKSQSFGIDTQEDLQRALTYFA